MKPKSTDWPQLIRDGGWDHRPDGSYWGVLRRVTSDGALLEVVHKRTESAFVLLKDSVFQFEGDLSDCLERGNNV